MASPVAPLTNAEKNHFLTHGWIRLANCFTREQAQEIVADVWTRLGMDPNDRSTWTRLRTNMPSHRTFDASEFAPKAWAAICELCGGEDRITPEAKTWRDGLIVNLGSPEYEGKDTDPRDLGGWHVDGDFFVHYLDSPEQALLVVPLFNDIVPGGGGTFICPEAISKIAKHLYDHPDGVSPHMCPRDDAEFSDRSFNRAIPWFNKTAQECTQFVEVHGNCGDVFLLHPLMLHSASMNPLRKLRIITNPPVSLREPFCFDRSDGEYSLVERTTLKALGKDHLRGWRITKPREAVIPERVRIQERMKMEELERLEMLRKVTATAS